MKVYCNGLNFYRQFPGPDSLLSNFVTSKVFPHLVDIEVSYTFAVLLVADTVLFQGASEIQILEKIAQIACTDDKIIALAQNGDLIKICENDLNSRTILPKLMDLDDDEKIVKIASMSKMSVALTEKGKLYNIPNKLEYENAQIMDIQTGREHCLLLDTTGCVFSFGRGSRGQLGHGGLDDEPEPRLVDALAGIQIAAIAAGGWHSCALSKDGDVYLWGWNSNGQVGQGESIAVIATPQVLDIGFDVRKIACGGRHTVMLSDDGKLYGCGWNKYKQLKGEEVENFHQVTYLHEFSMVAGVKCGPWNTLVLCEE